jgi:hypothetical protein
LPLGYLILDLSPTHTLYCLDFQNEGTIMLKSKGLRRGEICLNRDLSEEQENPVGNLKGGGKI